MISTHAPSPHFPPPCPLSGRKVTAPLSWQAPKRVLTLETQPQGPHSFVGGRHGVHLGQEYLSGGTPGGGSMELDPHGALWCEEGLAGSSTSSCPEKMFYFLQVPLKILNCTEIKITSE